MCKTLPSKVSFSGVSTVQVQSSDRKCILKSRKQVIKEQEAEIPASVFLAASAYGLNVAKAGLQKERRGKLYWHDPWGIREALLYSLRNACVALDSCNAQSARWLRKETKRFALTSSANLASAIRTIEKAISEDWIKHLKGQYLVSSAADQLNIVSMELAGDSVMTSSLALSNGGSMPRLGFGTAIFAPDCACEHGCRCQACKDMTGVLQAAVTSAIEQGYRHFDCAQCYNNEEVVGEALKASGVRRSELFLASKLSHKEDYGTNATRKAVRQQLQNLQTDYLDLYYLHDDIGDVRKEKAAWRALELLHEKGIVKHLGLSNYRTDGIERIMKYARVYPSVLQVKYDVYHPGYQWEEEQIDNVVAFAQLHSIPVVGYANFSGWPSLLQARNDPHVCNIAQRYDRSPTQIILRHGLQKGLALIPASVNPAHIKSNKELFDFSLSGSDVAHLDSLANLAAFKSVPWLPVPSAHHSFS